MGVPNFRFFSTQDAGRFEQFLVDLGANMANFRKKSVPFFWRKFPNSQKEISVVNSEIYFCPKKNRTKFFRKFALLVPRSTKNYSNRPASRVTKKIFGFLLGSACKAAQPRSSEKNAASRAGQTPCTRWAVTISLLTQKASVTAENRAFEEKQPLVFLPKSRFMVV